MVAFVNPVSLELVIDVVNGWAKATRVLPRPAGAPLYPPTTTLISKYDVDSTDWASDDVLASAADALYEVFSAPGAARVERLNVLLRSYEMTPYLTESGLGWSAPAAHQVAASLSAAILNHALVDPSLGRLGTCSADNCRDAFLDGTQAATRQFCSERCQSRIKAQRRRQRSRRAVPHHDSA